MQEKIMQFLLLFEKRGEKYILKSDFWFYY